jgi:hypothetical protein
MTGPAAPTKDAAPQVISVLTTEHFTLQSARSATISDSSGRASLYLSSISGSLVALSLLATATKLSEVFVATALILAVVVVFIGTVTFVRVLESAIEDSVYARGINRMRHAYLELMPEWRPYFVQSDRDDNAGMMGNMGLSPAGRFQMYLTTAGMVGILNSAVASSIVGGVLGLLHLRLGWIIVLVTGFFLLAAALHMRFQRRAWMNFEQRYPPSFPTDVPLSAERASRH